MNLKKSISRAGFTLIEVVIAMTVLALVVSVLYLAFANAGRIWGRQRLAADAGERESALLRLLSDDLARIQPYNFSWEKGRGFFFGVGERVLFYVTAAAFGARERRPAGLYFTCCFLEENPEGEGLDLYLIKEWGPRRDLLEAFSAFQERPEAALELSEELRAGALPVLTALAQASFSVVADPEKLHLPEGEIEDGALLEEKELKRNWTLAQLPVALLFTYQARSQEERQRFLLLPLQPPPALPAAKK